MDQTTMQQTVMDLSTEVACVALQPPMEGAAATDPTLLPSLPDVSLVPIDGSSTPDTDKDEGVGSSDDNEVVAKSPAQPPNYYEAFPALPSSGEAIGMSSPASLMSSAVVAPGTGWGAAARNNDSMRIQTSVITQVFHIHQDERAKIDCHSQFGESASSSICADITKKTGAHIEISSGRDHSLTFLVTGKNDAVSKAKKLVLEKFQTQNKHSIKIPKEHHRYLLGKKGKKLQDLEQNTSTKIQVPSQQDPSDVVTIIGTKECVEKAVHEIRVISDEQSKQAYEVVDVPKMYHPFVCGANNSHVTALMKEHIVRINVPPISVQKDELTITGEKESVLKCKEIISKLSKDMEKRCQTVSVEVAKNQHKYVIGQRGCNIAEILDMHGVSVEMPSQDSNSNTITLRGPQEKLGGALTLVYAKASSMKRVEVMAPAWLHRYVIGRKGANINKITEEFQSVHVEFTDKGEVINLEGPCEDVEKVREKLESMISEMMSRLKQDELIVDSKYHKHIIGKAGCNINRIRNETNVIINIEPNGNVIRMEGSPEAVEQVKKELEELVTKMENEVEREINIEYRLHRYIIGTKGERIRDIREQFNQVQVSLPDTAEKSDTVKVRGPKEDVDACCKHLQKLVKELMESNFQIKVPIFKQFVKYIIGKGGANINKIRADTDTRIDLSTTDQGSDEIIIIGHKENCERAAERIKQNQEELANITEMDIIVPAKFHKSIIGQRGRLIRSIREDCGGVIIKFPLADKKSDKVTIRGPKEDVQKAKKILVELSNEKQLSSFSEEVRCKSQHHKFLIGKNGATIRKLRDETGARIIFPADKEDDKETIVIMGKKDQVAAAKKSLESTIRDLDNIVESTVTVPGHYHLHFIQRRGEVLRQIEEQYGGVSISFPRNGQNSELVTIKGGVECVAGAKERILEVVKELDSQVSVEVAIPQRHHRTVMGMRGANVQRVIARFGVEIKFPDRASPEEEARRRQEEGVTGAQVLPCDIVRVKGSAEACEAAKTALLELVPITEQITVPYKYHRFIIGQRGQSVRALMTEHDVNIHVPPVIDHSDAIRITGLTENVASAKVALLAQAQGLEDEEKDKEARNHQVTIKVDPEYHPKIIGRKGAVVSKIRDKYGVNIQFPQPTDPDPTLITITGYEKNSEEAKQAILDITGDLDSMVKVSVDIDSRLHARLIGQGGKSIRKVMNDFKVTISFSRSEEFPDTVVISGPEDKANACKEHLLNQAEEYLQDIQEREELKSYRPSLTFGASFVDMAGGVGGSQPEENWGGEPATNEMNWVEESASSVAMSGRKPSQNGARAHIANGVSNKQGFVVSGAPWQEAPPNVNSSEDFPSMGSAPAAPVVSSAWGPRR